MTTLMLIALAAALFFVAHVFLLFTSFGKDRYSKTKYLWSHLTLWISGVLVFTLTTLYAGTGESGIVDVFDTPVRRGLILMVVAVLSIVAHTIVRYLVLPRYQVK
ncbi:hypothetical protein [Chitinophaga cymbidii]|uniref:Uncharacterized protein n=1 Tax=Chitinophaga cymbidii TaxID=1096750 RepID=A0A512RN94_9BACT|nr:hypothetical protein [Chitinophaga cymbidii]GEP97162.1 hypothetical protein CCY01nite_34220 [Chitinophaga cymbidii]